MSVYVIARLTCALSAAYGIGLAAWIATGAAKGGRA